MRSLVFLISVIWVANAGAQTMQFVAEPPDQRLIAVMGNAWKIFAAGPIDTGAAKRLEAILTSRGIPRESDIFLHSPGGNMFEGMELGKVMRKWNLRAHVGQRTTERNSQGGICYSACSLAFLGGEFRFVSKDSKFGVHQFTTAAPSPHDLAIAQMASAAVVEYIRSMDVDPGLFNLAAGTLSSDMHILTQAKMLELHVVNNGIKATKWSVESLPAAIYLKGERETIYGINKTLIVCGDKKLLLWFIFDPQGRADEVMQMNATSVLIDGEPVPIRGSEKQARNGWINTTIALDADLLSRVRAAKTIGVAHQWAHGAPIFLGFDGMPFAGGAARLDGILDVCR